MNSNQIELLNRKKSFENWCVEHGALRGGASDEALSLLRARGFQVFEESSADKVRLEASLFLTRRRAFNNISVSLFYGCASLLVSYAEFLEATSVKEPELPASDNKGKSRDDRESDLLIVAYYLARREYKALKDLHYECMQSAFEDVSSLLETTPDVIRGMVYEYKSYFANGGYEKWHQKAFEETGRKVSEYCDKMDHNELSVLVKEILSEYGWKDESNILGLSGDKKRADQSVLNICNIFDNCRYK